MPKAEYSHLYGRRWKAASKAFLKRNPLCCFHQARGELAMATLVDHKTPHRGDRGLFWSQDNWAPLCKPCHDSVKQRIEKSGRVTGCDVDGIPLDPAHPWAAERDAALSAGQMISKPKDRGPNRTGLPLDTARAIF